MLFQWNNFGNTEVSQASEVLKVAAWTIPAYAISTFLVKALHSKKNMKAPFQAAMVSLVTNTCFSLFLMKDFGIIGLSFANLLAAYAQCAFLAFRCKFFRVRSLFDFQGVDVTRILAASMVLGASLFVGQGSFQYWCGQIRDGFTACLFNDFGDFKLHGIFVCPQVLMVR